MPQGTWSDDEVQVLRALDRYYTGYPSTINSGPLAKELQMEWEALDAILLRLKRLGLVRNATTMNEVWEIHPAILEAVEELDKPEPPVDWPSRAWAAFRGRRVSVVLLVAFAVVWAVINNWSDIIDFLDTVGIAPIPQAAPAD